LLRGGILRTRGERKAGCAEQNHGDDLPQSLVHRDLGKE